MRRREFIVGGAIAWPLTARAQQPAMPVIGFLTLTKPITSFVTGFRRGLSELGYVEGTNVTIDYRSAEGQPDRLPALAADLVQRPVAVIVLADGSGSLAAKRATNTIPIVFATGLDPVATGLVASFPRPGGNVTGLYVLTVRLIAKRLELLHQLVPAAMSMALLVYPGSTAPAFSQAEGQTAALALGVDLLILNARSKDEIEAAFVSLTKQRVGALLVAAHPLFRTQNEQIVALAARYAVPTSYESTIFTKVGGLMSYGTDDDDIARQLGAYTGRILKGEKPSELPVIQPTKFELVINMKTAKTLGLTVPQSLLARADEVIE
jgi:putative tryptophan/tyrosine transport system substrate-binding protein